MKPLQIKKYMLQSELQKWYKSEKGPRLKIRLLAVLQLYEGKTVPQTAWHVRVSEVSVRKWIHWWNELGPKGLIRGKNTGRTPLLSSKEKLQLKEEILSSPRNWGYDFSTWRLKDITGHMARTYKLEMSVSGVWRMMKRLGFTMLVPRLMPAKADPFKKMKFIKQLTHLINDLQENEVILFQDESPFYFSPEPHRIWALKGSRPKLPVHGGRKRLNVIGAIDPILDEGFFQYIKNLDAANFGQFLRRILAQYPPNVKIYMILDNARPHHAKLLRNWLEKNKNRLELMFLPTYCPDLNPIEGIWQDVKREVVYNHFFAKFEEFQDALTQKLQQKSVSKGAIVKQCNLAKYSSPLYTIRKVKQYFSRLNCPNTCS